MAKYQRVKGGEKNARTGLDWTKPELERVCNLYIDIEGKGIHENNPKIHTLAKELDRTVRSVENQLLAFRKVDTGDTGRENYNNLIPEIWEDFKSKVAEHKENRIKDLEQSKLDADTEFKFRVSSQLKNIIGKDLITDDYLAIFELVKNSYDAHAREVIITFDEDRIVIRDNGKGMDKQDIVNKWLFVAYSAKKEGVEDKSINEDEAYSNYRDKIRPRTHYAGAKGIGRFSTDRLGTRLKLTSKTPAEHSNYHQLMFNWDIFEVDALEKFDDIAIDHKELPSTEYINFNHGVILEISGLHNLWDRGKILYLKWSLEKLINPFEPLDNSNSVGNFNIKIVCDREKNADLDANNEREKVNGYVKNFVFETLEIKTTQIEAQIVEDGEKIETTLTDRGILVYKIREINPYNYLTNTAIQLFYLNTSAKNNFTRLMGIPAVQFGNVFLFNNGFRIYPFGEPTHDPFGIDRRKAQGYARNLGSRELIGRVEILENPEQFKETSSRDGGLVDTPGTRQLEEFFRKTLSKLEDYVTPILWKIKDRSDNGEENIDTTAKAQVVKLVSRLANAKNIELIEYDENLLDIINEKVDTSSSELFDDLAKLAAATDDKKFEEQIRQGKDEYLKLLREKEDEQIKREQAEEKAQKEEERRRVAEELANQIEQERKDEELRRLKAEEELRLENEKRIAEEQRRRQKESEVRFLQSVQSLDIEDVLNLHHQIGIDANIIEGEIYNLKRKIDKGGNITNDQLMTFLDRISFALKKIHAVTKFTTKENFMAASRVSNDDIILFIKNYVINILKYHLGNDLRVEILDKVQNPYIIEFKPIEITIIIDNLLNNSKKKHAKNIAISFTKETSDSLTMRYLDDGDGLDKTIHVADEIFNKGVTTTKGSGLGLFHIKKILNEINSTIEVNPNLEKGIEFIINFRKS